MGICYQEIPLAEIAVIEPLWEKLNQYHIKQSRDFGSEFRQFSFAERLKRIKGKTVWIMGACDDSANMELVGYCLASINAALSGEVESIYIEPEYRERGIVSVFMQRSIKWLEEAGVREIILRVAVGNEKALGFYDKFGFKPKTYKLKKIQDYPAFNGPV